MVVARMKWQMDIPVDDFATLAEESLVQYLEQKKIGVPDSEHADLSQAMIYAVRHAKTVQATGKGMVRLYKDAKGRLACSVVHMVKDAADDEMRDREEAINVPALPAVKGAAAPAPPPKKDDGRTAPPPGTARPAPAAARSTPTPSVRANRPGALPSGMRPKKS